VVVTFILGVDFGATNLKAIVATTDGVVAGRAIEPSLVSEGPTDTLDRIASVVLRAAQQWPITAIGVGACGLVDHGRGTLTESPVLPGWHHVPIAEALRDATSLPVVIDNDANCAVLGEWWLGAGERRDVVAGLTLGTGIGGGLIVRGEVFRGAGGWAGEFGHIALADGPACLCGGRGCLGQLASASATVARYREISGDTVSGTEELARRAAAGDESAIAALVASAEYLARGVRILVNVLNPHVFVLTGGMAGWGAELAHAVRDALQGTTFGGLDTTPVRLATLGMFSGAFGAVRLAADATQPDGTGASVDVPAPSQPGSPDDATRETHRAQG
jgi:glucokinase